MTCHIYVRADEYYNNIDILENMIEGTISTYVEYPETYNELFASVFDGVKWSVSPSKKAPQVLQLDDSNIVNPEDVVVGIDDCWVKIEDYATDMWTLYMNAYTEIMTSELISDRVKNIISTELDDIAHLDEFIDDMSLLDIRRYTENG